MIDTNNDAAMRAEAERRTALRMQGAQTFDNIERLEIPAPDSRALEKQIERDCDTLMQQLGFEVIRFSHPGKTMQTPGIADRLYLRGPRPDDPNDRYRCMIQGRYSKALSVWAELKSATGRQRPGQKLFQELVTDAGHEYVIGGIDAVVQWLVSQRLGTVRNGAFEPTEGR